MEEAKRDTVRSLCTKHDASEREQSSKAATRRVREGIAVQMAACFGPEPAETPANLNGNAIHDHGSAIESPT